jgi:thioredoxin-like negative regulator of GroEL
MNRTVERWTFGRHGALPPCRMAAPEVHELAAGDGGTGLSAQGEHEEYATLATQFRVQSIPILCSCAGE